MPIYAISTSQHQSVFQLFCLLAASQTLAILGKYFGDTSSLILRCEMQADIELYIRYSFAFSLTRGERHFASECNTANTNGDGHCHPFNFV